MVQQDLVKLVKSIDDGEAATLTLTDSNNDHHTFQGFFKESEAPGFFFLAPPGALPQQLDRSWRGFLVSCDQNGTEVSFLVEIVEKTSGRTVELLARQTMRFEDMRRFFRVSMRIPVVIRHFSDSAEKPENSWQLEGESVDISQSGLLALLPAECRHEDDLDIELLLDEPDKRIIVGGHVVRSRSLRKQRWLTSFHFDDISATNRDALAKRCFAEQRRQLREKGQTY